MNETENKCAIETNTRFSVEQWKFDVSQAIRFQSHHVIVEQNVELNWMECCMNWENPRKSIWFEANLYAFSNVKFKWKRTSIDWSASNWYFPSLVRHYYRKYKRIMISISNSIREKDMFTLEIFLFLFNEYNF